MLCLSGFELYSRWVPLFKGTLFIASSTQIRILALAFTREYRAQIFQGFRFKWSGSEILRSFIIRDYLLILLDTCDQISFFSVFRFV